MVRNLLMLLLAFQTVTSDENTRLLSSLLRRVGTLEKNVEILGEQLDELKAELRPGSHYLEEPEHAASTDRQSSEVRGNERTWDTGHHARLYSNTGREGGSDFKITGISATFSSSDGDTRFTIQYETHGDQPLVMMTPNYKTPPSRVEHSMGTVHLLIPRKDATPVVYVYTSSGLFYTLTLINQLGSSSASSNVSNVAMSTSPQPPITFQPNENPEFTLVANVTGNRQVASQELSYTVYPIKDYSDVVAETFHLPTSSQEDVGGGQSNKQRLRIIDRGEDEGEKRFRLELETRYEDRGVLLVQYSVMWDCAGGCVLYKTIVEKPVLFFREGTYELSGSAIVPSRRGRPREAGNYVNFISYNPYSNKAQKTCREGEPCLLECSAFGDYPTVTIRTNVDISSMPGVRTWSLNVGYISHGFVLFESVTKQAEGQYQCHASLDAVRKVKDIVLRVSDK